MNTLTQLAILGGFLALTGCGEGFNSHGDDVVEFSNSANSDRQAQRTLKNLKQDCSGSEICDPLFKGSLLLQHPNVDYLQGQYPEDFNKSNLYSYIGNGKEANMYWVVGNHWVSDHQIANSEVQRDSTFFGGFYRSNASRQPASLNNEVNVVKNPLLNALRFSNASEGQKREDLSQLEIYGTDSTAMIFNRGENRSLFGSLILSFDTFVDYFGSTNRNQLKQDLAGDKTLFEKREILANAINRIESGQVSQLTGGEACDVNDTTFNRSAPTRYCKWPHYGMSHTFDSDLSLRNGFVFATEIRLLDFYDEGNINQAMNLVGFSRYYNHMNMRIQLKRKRNNPISYFDRRKGKVIVKDYDRVAVSIPIVEPKELCLSAEFSQNNSICNTLTAKVTSTSTIHSKPDIGTGQFMYKMGKEGFQLGIVEGGGTDAEDKMIKFAEGKTLMIRIEDIPGFEEQLRAAVTGCKDNHQTWGIPVEWCEMENYDWHNYKTNAINFGFESPGVFRAALQINYLNFRTK